MSIGVITNPRSRRNVLNPQLARGLAYVLGEKGEIASPEDLDALGATAARFRDRQIDVLCVNGGDGTLHRVLTAMVRAYGPRPLPRVALLRGGTMNTVASGIGVRGKPADILEHVVENYAADKPMALVRRWLLQVDGDQYGFMFGTGLFARFLEVYYETGDPTPLSAACVLTRVAGSALIGGKLARELTARKPAVVELDGRVWPREDYATVAVGTVDDIGLGFKVFYNAPKHPGHLQVVGIAADMKAIPGMLYSVHRGRRIPHPGVQDEVGTEVVIRQEEAGGFMIDGDFHRGGQTLTVRVGPPVDFVVPAW